jgi:hypothetical protein
MQGGAVDIGTGRLSAPVVEGDLRGLRFDGSEVLRRVSYPVRDAGWGTFPTVTLTEEAGPGRYHRCFAEAGGLFEGDFHATIDGERQMRLSVSFRFSRAAQVNRAGFTVLHPLDGVAGEPVRVRHPDGSFTNASFPRLIAPGQPARNITGLSHAVRPVTVDLSFAGEVFEMEDQRNWSDASFKTYCRPLSLPRPFAVQPGETVRQEITLQLGQRAVQSGAAGPAAKGVSRLPQVMLVHEPGLSTIAALAAFPGVPVLLRMGRVTPDADLAALSPRRDVAVEVVFETLADLHRKIGRLHRSGLRPLRVIGLPCAYLASHQPEGPWPAGPAPRDAMAPLRDAFPGVLVGSGSLSHFTEFNRCPPDAAADFASFGNSAIVHSADDTSVCETLEALPAIFSTAQALAADKPLHLGLFSIGMRSNLYGAAVVPNPDGLPTPMSTQDARQRTGFAAAYAVAILAAAARAGVDSLALAMPDGPLGAEGSPLATVIRAASGAAGREVRWPSSEGGVSLAGPGFAFTAKAGQLMEAAA